VIESLELFKDIASRKIFADTPIFLFLNKKDLFENMCLETDLKVCFPEYEGGKNLQNALAFVEKKFRDQLPPGKDVVVSVVASVVRRELKAAFEDVKKILFDTNRPKIDAEKLKIKKSHEEVEMRKRIKPDDPGCCFCMAEDVRPGASAR